MPSDPDLVVVPHRDVVVDVLGIVAAEYGVRVAEIMAGCRSKGLAEARQRAAALLRDVPQLSFPEIGKAMGRDHTTIIHAVKATAKACMRDPYQAERYARMRAAVVEARAARRVA